MMAKPLMIISSDHGTASPDCACPDAAFGARFEGNCADRYWAHQDSITISLPNDFTLLMSAYAESGPCVVNRAGWERYKKFIDRDGLPIASDFDQLLAKQHLISPIESRIHVVSKRSETLTAWIHVTNACNLDCPYCYVRKTPSHMTESTAKQSIEWLIQYALSHRFKKIKIKYAGGESTLNFRVVKTAHELLKSVAAENHLTTEEILLTNGFYISKPNAEWLRDANIKVMISIDGIGAIHDIQRPQKNGLPSFQAVEHTLKYTLLPAGIWPSVTVTITKQNATAIREVIGWLLSMDLQFALNFYRQGFASQTREELAIEEQALIHGLREAYQVIESRLPTKPFVNGLLDRVQFDAHTHTCGVGNSYLVVSHKGELSQCQMHMAQPIGSIFESDKDLRVDQPIRNLSVDEKEGCRECVYRYRCTGGCPIETFRATGRWDVQNPNCNIYRKLLPEALRLEGLWLLKTSGYL